MRDQLAPVAAIRRRQRRRVDAEVDRLALVGEDEEVVAAIEDGVAHAGLARRHQARRGVGLRQVDQPALGGFLVAGGDDAEAAARTLLDTREPAAVLFLVDQHVVALRRAQAMAVDLQRPVVLVEADIVEERRIAAPDDAAAGLLDDVGQILAALPSAHADGEILRAAQIGAPGLEAMVRRMLRVAEFEIRRRLGERVAVEDDPVIAAVARRAADQPRAGRPGGISTDRRTARRAPARPKSSSLMRPRISATSVFCSACVGPRTASVWRFSASRYDLMSGSSSAGLRRTCLPVGVLQPGIVVREGDAMDRATEADVVARPAG